MCGGEVGQGRFCAFGGEAEARDCGNVFSACAGGFFLTAAVEQRGCYAAYAQCERADALGAADFVGGEGEEIYAEVDHVNFDAASSLDGVAMKERAV